MAARSSGLEAMLICELLRGIIAFSLSVSRRSFYRLSPALRLLIDHAILSQYADEFRQSDRAYCFKPGPGFQIHKSFQARSSKMKTQIVGFNVLVMLYAYHKPQSPGRCARP
ncbi:hypothetical protein BDP81DRAFT_85280 [Colletotrichum phormii]|uniref:Uncharacterized protein n=1 Tax=Colletotrichum phormii TaxID=359342 RepID=A0AAJ0A152_9PEZI|nr:uncharacterized protein BDP81DRAFT_85280 [Colletotrichum phormii]KAK1654552.1 hypothetical protein BDP81DRAFT_85280 [Colletotrichum phormii]